MVLPNGILSVWFLEMVWILDTAVRNCKQLTKRII